MKGSTPRQSAIASISGSYITPPVLSVPTETIDQIFGSSVFGVAEMEKRLPKAVFKSLLKTAAKGSKLDISVADAVAAVMKDWAIEKGATHYAHVFFPLTGITAEKHDSFYEPTGWGASALAEFAGKVLVQGEPDASSFPSGGLRQTSQARGYTAWDPTSPAYIMESVNGRTLCIPTAFVSWTGEALDKKVPLLRSMQAVNAPALRILKMFGHEGVGPISATCGPEQEYFLIDRNFFFQRTDLLNAGRTLFGAKPPKGQEFEDQYFGVIPERVQAFMYDLERDLYKLGVPVKTRHNEVAPGQYEIAPLYESANLAHDHQQLIMTMIQKVAPRYGLAALLHEKPFAGVNGSGKHVNWSVGGPGVGNLIEPGATPHDNAQFLVFCCAVIRSVDIHAKLLRATVASSGNDHRLGANEAPPAIISIFLGDQLHDVLEQVKSGGAKSSKPKGTLQIGVDTLPELPKDAGDRNRTSPFAFTGNKFEFRAVGSTFSIADPLVVLNTILAESLDFIADELEAKTGGDASKLNGAIQEVLQAILVKHFRVCFGGNGYSEEWHAEAAERGLPNLKSTVDALPEFVSPQTVALFEKYSVLNEAELHSRYEIYVERYIKDVTAEANLALNIAKTQILSAALEYETSVAASAAAGSKVGAKLLAKVAGLVSGLDAGIEKLEHDLAHTAEGAPLDHAKYFHSVILPDMLEIRGAADELEAILPSDLWPLPTYQEMLFMR